MSKAVVVETRRQHAGVGIIQSLNVGIKTTRVEKIIAPNIDVVKRGILIGYAAKLGNGSGRVYARRNLSRSFALLADTIRVVDIPQMVFTNPKTTFHVNRTANRTLMSSMATRGCRSANVVNSRGGYQELIIVIAPIFYHRNGHYVRPNKVAIKYLDFKKMLIQMLMSKCSM
jgi:ribosomal protein L17